jgi:hypothetical protein
VALERAGRGTPAERLSVALGQTKEECKVSPGGEERGGRGDERDLGGNPVAACECVG